MPSLPEGLEITKSNKDDESNMKDDDGHTSSLDNPVHCVPTIMGVESLKIMRDNLTIKCHLDPNNEKKLAKVELGV